MLHFTCRGHGAPLVMFHGLFGSAENLGAIARELSHRFKVYSVDLPEHGRSPHSSVTSLKAMAETVAQWFGLHGLTHAHVVGHSLGGKVAMELALKHQTLIDKLVVMDIAPVAYDAHHHNVFAGLAAIDMANVKSRGDAEAAMQACVSDFAVRSFLLKNMVKAPGGHFTWRMNLPVLQENYEQLIAENSSGRFSGDTLFLKGGGSDYITASHRQAIMHRFPAAQLKIVANTGHWLHAEKPELVSKLILKFLA